MFNNLCGENGMERNTIGESEVCSVESKFALISSFSVSGIT